MVLKTASAVFTGGAFKIVQSANPALPTQLLLRAKPRTTCGVRGPAAAKRAKVLGKLWGSGHGRFKTSGRFASATVRGTVWFMAERCDGSYVYVKRGRVEVEDLVRHKTFVLNSGQSYLARAS